MTNSNIFHRSIKNLVFLIVMCIWHNVRTVPCACRVFG